MTKNINLIIVILSLGFLIRLINFDFPYFTEEEARIAYRGYTLSHFATDELGRNLPFLFNSLSDYRLPLVSYIVAFGELFFGKNEIGVRLPFIVIGTFLILISYLISKSLFKDKSISLYTSVLVAFAPPLYFLSKVPNEEIVLTVLFALTFYYLIRPKINYFLLIVLFLLIILTEKIAWFILPIFVIYTICFVQKKWGNKHKWLICATPFFLSALSLIVYLNIEQGLRSLLENNFLNFYDLSISNGINRLRGQVYDANLAQILGKIFFNKTHYVTYNLSSYLSNISLDKLFGELDSQGVINFPLIGVWEKILIIPFLIGVYTLIRYETNYRFLLGFIIVFTYPLIFQNSAIETFIFFMPFVAMIIALGLSKLRLGVSSLILILALFELILNLVFPISFIKKTNNIRPVWIQNVIDDASSSFGNTPVAYSDKIITDIIPYVAWNTNFRPDNNFENLKFPYKFNQSSLWQIRTINSDEKFNRCEYSLTKTRAYVTEKDIKRLKRYFESVKFNKVFKDSTNTERVYLLADICLN